LFILFLLQIFIGPSYAQEDYPIKPVNLIVPWPVGGLSDIIARIIAEIGRKHFPQPFIVVNRAGASGTAGMQELVNSKPDGYTIAFATNSEGGSSLHILHAAYTIDSYTIICRTGGQPVCIATKGPWNSLKEFVDYTRKNPDKIRAGVPGLGTIVRLTGEQFAIKAGLKFKVVPFKGSGPSLTALLGGHIEIGLMNVPEIISLYKAGELKVLCVFSDKRSKPLPGVPTAKEQGFDVVGGATQFIIVPNGVPKQIREKLDGAMKKALEDPEFNKKTTELGYMPSYADSETSKALIKEWYKTSGELYNMLGMKKE
jgi:tripartite-type tricarboxylate transporter receptor subunit TctC